MAAAQVEAEAQAEQERSAHEAHLAQQRLVQEKAAQEQLAALEAERAASTSHDNLSTQPAAAQPGTPVMPRFAARTQQMHVHQPAPEPEPTLEDLWASALVEPRSLLPSKLIEFPRELVSSHRARPRLPESPEQAQRQEAQQSESAQLRIFEVQSESEAEKVALDAPAQTPLSETEIYPPSIDANHPAASNDAVQNMSPEPARSSPRSTVAATAANRVQSAACGTEMSARIPTPKPGHREGYAAASRTAPESGSSSARTFKNLEWAAISLDKEPAARSRKQESSVAEGISFLIEPASIDRRLMAFAVDFAAVTAGFLGFLVVFVASTPHLPTGLTAIALAGVVYAALWLLYQMLFFSFGGATAGMLYARIALCTFDDQNPTRSALRRRLGAWWLSCLPLGLGFLWCFVDEDNLSWHDRMTGTYQRSY